MGLTGLSFLGGSRASQGEARFQAREASSGTPLEPAFSRASLQDLDRAVQAAVEAFPVYSKLSATVRSQLLRSIALGLEGSSSAIVSRAMAETGLAQARLEGELARTCGQLRLFAGVVEEGSWIEARVDRALPERKPLPRPDMRSMLVPLGPVAVFGASNFPLAFSVAGGDTAAALAAGCAVIVKAHPAHPGTSELVAAVIAEAVAAAGLPGGVFSLLFDDGVEIGSALVQHPGVEAVAFTGSHRGGRALMDLAAARLRPIPCFAEMSSLNPVIVLRGALADPAAQARALYGSFTLGAGQFCTKPGLVFVEGSENTAAFCEELKSLTRGSSDFTLLTAGIAEAYREGLAARKACGVQFAEAEDAARTVAVVFEVSVEELESTALLGEEHFGPSTVVVRWTDRGQLLKVLEGLEGHLTATVLGSTAEIEAGGDLVGILERKVGRLIFNGYPTGVEVAHAMVHGGPYPATSDSRFTSVGSQAILRFARPRCYQNFPQAALPEELRDANPGGIPRMVDGEWTRDPIRA